jgi:glycosyltransferase involved in cell wall biosynthesis
MPPLSIAAIIPTYNYAHGIKQAIASVLNQTLAPVEIIVVDGLMDATTRKVNQSELAAMSAAV